MEALISQSRRQRDALTLLDHSGLGLVRKPENTDARSSIYPGAHRFHEAIDLDVLRRLVPDQQRVEAIVRRHTTPEQAAGIFGKVSPRLAVFSHSPGTAAIVEQTKQSYSGRVEMGEDLMVIDIGTEVRVKPAEAGARPR